jgi:uncharacterized damage-inducible protein DinB
MTTKELLIKEFSASFDEENWFIPLTRAIDGLSAEEAAWKDGSSNHSVWQLVNHIYFWNERYFHRFKDTPLPSIKITNDETFDHTNESDWKVATERLISLMNEWRQLMQKSPESKFDEECIHGKPEPWASVIAQINLHTSYHVGQILYVRRQQGKWNPA